MFVHRKKYFLPIDIHETNPLSKLLIFLDTLDRLPVHLRAHRVRQPLILIFTPTGSEEIN